MYGLYFSKFTQPVASNHPNATLYHDHKNLFAPLKIPIGKTNVEKSND